jgi:ABC-2 type transport system ATP-binding protein
MQKPISIKSIKTSYNKKTIIDNISFDVQKGDVFGLIGINGAGKTTLIRSLLGLAKHEGQGLIFGKEGREAKNRASAFYLPEKFIPSPSLTAFEYLEISQNFYKKQLDKEKASEICEKLGLEKDNFHKKTRAFSKGMSQKLGLASAFLSNNDLLILDEPMSGLDPLARVKLKQTIKEYVKSKEKTIFFSSHVLSDIEELCSKIVILDNKSIIFDGSPKYFMQKHDENSLEQAFIKAVC